MSMSDLVDYEVGDLVEWRTGETFEPDTQYLFVDCRLYLDERARITTDNILFPKEPMLVLDLIQVGRFPLAKVLVPSTLEIGYRVDYHFVRVNP